MPKSFNEIVTDADWKELTPRLLYYADQLIRKCPWRGIPVSASAGSKLCVDGYGADDFLHEALERLLSGRRAYDHSVSLERNVRRSIRSIVWSANKSSRRTPLIDIARAQDENLDPIQQFPSAASSADTSAIAFEQAEEQKAILEEFEKSLAAENELMRLVAAYKSGHFKPREIEQFTGIPAARISELKRKLRVRIEQFEARDRRRHNT